MDIRNDPITQVEDDDLTDFLPPRPPLEPPTPRQFKPWHKPRKQYIRRHQWCKEVTGLIPLLSLPPENKVVRYLSLPSEDMLDVRTLAETLGDDLKLKYVGFFYTKDGSPDDQRMNLSERAVKALDKVDDSSHIARDMLENTGNPRSQAYQTLKSHAPYHVVNIDLCNHFAPPRRPNVYGCIEALRSIANIQHEKNGGNGWLLFLTTRIKPDYFDVEHLRAFIRAIQENSERSSEFKSLLGEVFAQESETLLAKLSALAKSLEQSSPEKIGENNKITAKADVLSQDEFRKFFCVGFGKWFLSYLCGSSPQTKVEMLPSYYYAIGSERHDMLSLAFKCTPQIQPLQDRFELVTSVVGRKPSIDEPKQGMQILQKSNNLVNLDLFLASNPETMECMIKESIHYLKSADYDISCYRDFANRPI